MQVATTRRSTRSSGFSGSVRESRMMKSENGKGRIKDFNGDKVRDLAGFRVYGRVKKNQNVDVVEKRTWRTESVCGIEKSQIQQMKVRSKSLNLSVSDENSKDFGICKEKIVVSRSKSSNDSGFRSGSTDWGSLKPTVDVDKGKDEEEQEEHEEEYEDEEDYQDEEEEKSMNVVEVEFSDVKKTETIAESKQIQIHHIPVSEVVEVQPPIAETHPDPPSIKPYLRKPISTPDLFESTVQNRNRMQNIVDMVMWRDISKSAFVFGLGTFLLLSSSFTKDLNFSVISAISHMGLLYLAIIFFYRSILCRGAIDLDEKNLEYTVGEEDAIWLLKLILPYLNEVLSKLREIFSGDPATTMKLSVLLFLLARGGSSITIWTMAKLAFFGVFTIPKVCSSYSVQLSGFGKFWVRRFKDAWNSCSHKKAVAAAVFTVIWNLSSIVARIWGIFFLVVVVRFYQQSLREDEWGDQPSELESKEMEDQNNQNQNQNQTHIKRHGPTLKEIARDKKGL